MSYNPPSIYIILSTNHIGGAENRFIGLWQWICSKDISCALVVTEKLYQHLLPSVIKCGSVKIFTDETRGFRDFRKKIKVFLKAVTRKRDVTHFVGDHPLYFMRGRNKVFSITQSSLQNLNSSGKRGQYLGIALSNQIDILDPSIEADIKSAFFYKKDRISRTASSFVDDEIFSPLPWEEKKNWIVFLGRLEEMKQVVRLVNALPLIDKTLGELKLDDLKFFILGHGSQEAMIREKLNSPEYQEIPIHFGFQERPEEILNQSKVFLSLQLHNNYPSKSLLEAMAAGNIPLVTDNGQTRWIARPSFSYYVPEQFQPEDLAEMLKKIFQLSEKDWLRKTAAARSVVSNEHTLEIMGDYYLKLYNRFGSYFNLKIKL